MVTRRTLNRLIGGACALASTGGFTTRAMANSASDIAFAPPPPDIWDSHGWVRRAGGRLHYATLGAPDDQPPVVLLHKLGGWVADWRGVAPALARDRMVIAIDLPGHGASTWDGAPPEVQSVHETAMLVRGALEELGRTMGFAKVHLAGTSLGGCVAVALAALCPQMVERLALPSCVLGAARTWDEVMEKEAGQAGMFTPEAIPSPAPPRCRGRFSTSTMRRALPPNRTPAAASPDAGSAPRSAVSPSRIFPPSCARSRPRRCFSMANATASS